MSCVVDAIYKLVVNTVDFPEDENTPQKATEKLFSKMDTVISFSQVTWPLIVTVGLYRMVITWLILMNFVVAPSQRPL